jgi:hypothetical protein
MNLEKLEISEGIGADPLSLQVDDSGDATSQSKYEKINDFPIAGRRRRKIQWRQLR